MHIRPPFRLHFIEKQARCAAGSTRLEFEFEFELRKVPGQKLAQAGAVAETRDSGMQAIGDHLDERVSDSRGAMVFNAAGMRSGNPAQLDARRYDCGSSQ